MNLLLARQRVDMQQFLADLASGDPVVWTLTIVFGGLSLFGLYKKFRMF
jgi:hypothetical protein